MLIVLKDDDEKDGEQKKESKVAKGRKRERERGMCDAIHLRGILEEAVAIVCLLSCELSSEMRDETRYRRQGTRGAREDDDKHEDRMIDRISDSTEKHKHPLILS